MFIVPTEQKALDTRLMFVDELEYEVLVFYRSF